MDAWFQGLREGRAFVSSGPLVELTVNGRMPGETVELGTGGGSVDVTAHVKSITPLQKVILVHNGEVIDEFTLSGERNDFDL